MSLALWRQPIIIALYICLKKQSWAVGFDVGLASVTSWAFNPSISAFGAMLISYLPGVGSSWSKMQNLALSWLTLALSFSSLHHSDHCEGSAASPSSVCSPAPGTLAAFLIRWLDFGHPWTNLWTTCTIFYLHFSLNQTPFKVQSVKKIKLSFL